MCNVCLNMSPKSKFSLTILFVLCASLTPSNADDFPSPIEKCHMSDEKCQLEQVHKFLTAHPHGLPEFGIDDLEPYKLEDIDILGDKNSAASFDLYLMDVKMYGFSKMNVTKNSGFTKDTSKPMILHQVSYQPELILKAKYRVDGKILVLPIKGEGDFEWILSGVDSKTKIILKPEIRDDGKTYLQIEDYKILSKMDNVKTNMTNLFNGDKALSENVLKVINENWKLLSADITPKINAAIANENKKRLNKLFGKIPYENFFLSDE